MRITYPILKPDNYVPRKRRNTPLFKRSEFVTAIRTLNYELSKMNIIKAELQTNVQLNQAGQSFGLAVSLDDHFVAAKLEFWLNDQKHIWICDKYQRTADCIQGLSIALKHLRMFRNQELSSITIKNGIKS